MRQVINQFKSVFGVLSDKERYFDEIYDKPGGLLLYQIISISIIALCTGLVIGSYHSSIQAISAGLKLVILPMALIVICFPSFFIIQKVLGSQMKWVPILTVILSGFLLTTIVVFSFSPVLLFFMFIGSSYHFLQLLLIAIFLFGGFFGLRLMLESLKYACEKKRIYPQIGVSVFKVWVVVMAIVSMQLSWNLRPFVGQKGEEFKWFRHYKGNFYTAVIYSIKQLGKSESGSEPASDEPEETEYEQPVFRDH